MFVPLWDHNPLESVRFQFVTIGLIIVNCAVFFALQLGLIYPVPDALQVSFALVPHELLSTIVKQPVATAPVGASIPEGMTLITYMFMHGSFMHLFGNMIFLWVFGDNVEDAMGHARFLFFYLICGIFAGMTHALVSPASDIPLIGASGAVAGVIAAYLMLHPNVRVWCLWFFRIPLRVSAGFALLVWIALQVLNIVIERRRLDCVVGAYWRADRGCGARPVHAAAGRTALRSGNRRGTEAAGGCVRQPVRSVTL